MGSDAKFIRIRLALAGFPLPAKKVLKYMDEEISETKPKDRGDAKRLPDFGIFHYENNSAKRIGSFWIYTACKQNDPKYRTYAKGRVESTVTLTTGEWLTAFATVKGYVFAVLPRPADWLPTST